MRDICRSARTTIRQFDHPVWEPLLEAVGEELAGGFMWMHEEACSDGSAIHAYKHRHTRRYLYLDDVGQAYEATPCGAKVPDRLDFAIQRALCTWWLLSGWDDADRRAVVAAVHRAQAALQPGT